MPFRFGWHRCTILDMGHLTTAVLTMALAVGLSGCSASTGETTPAGTDTPAQTTTSAPSTTPAPTTQSPSSEPSSTAVPTTAPPTAPEPEPTSSPNPQPQNPPPPDPVIGAPAAWLGTDWQVLPGVGKKVALTFDAGASNAGVGRIVTTLSQQAATGTFFATGQFARKFPESIAQIAQAGFPIGNHSDTHRRFSTSTNVVIRQELAAAEAAISAVTGTTTKPLFRFPYGDRTQLDIDVVNAAGYIPIRWTVDSLGWKGTEGGARTAATVCQRVLTAARDGAIVLLHVGANPTDGSLLDADALPCIIQGFQQRGYGFVTLRDVVR